MKPYSTTNGTADSSQLLAMLGRRERLLVSLDRAVRKRMRVTLTCLTQLRLTYLRHYTTLMTELTA